MKIRTIERITEIEADARELRESNTLADNFATMLARCFQSREPFEEPTMEEFMQGQDPGDPEDGSL